MEVGKSQHKYIIGKGRTTINEILRDTGVSVEMPPSDSPSETITLRGPAEVLGNGKSAIDSIEIKAVVPKYTVYVILFYYFCSLNTGI